MPSKKLSSGLPMLALLPIETVQHIIPYTMPEGIVAFALTCRLLYLLALPFLRLHRSLRSENRFDLRRRRNTAYGILLNLADQPLVARYLQVLTFSTLVTPIDSAMLSHLENNGALSSMLSRSWYLREAGLKWRDFHAQIMEDLRAGRHSHAASVFLLSLVPNATTLMLNCRGRPTEESGRLLDVIVRETHCRKWGNMPSLANVEYLSIQFERAGNNDATVSHSGSSVVCNLLEIVSSFLTLPNLRAFQAGVHEISKPSLEELAVGKPNMVLHKLSLYGSWWFDPEIIAYCLRHVPNLTTLGIMAPIMNTIMYNIASANMPKFLDVFWSLTADHLESLDLQLGNENDGHITPVQPFPVTFQAFSCLRSVKLTMDLVVSNLYDATLRLEPPRTRILAEEADDFGVTILNMMPPTIKEVCFLGLDPLIHARALKLQFVNFGQDKRSRLPELRTVDLVMQDDDFVIPRHVWTWLSDFARGEARAVGVEVKLGGSDLYYHQVPLEDRVGWQMWEDADSDDGSENLAFDLDFDPGLEATVEWDLLEDQDAVAEETEADSEFDLDFDPALGDVEAGPESEDEVANEA